MPSGGHLSIRAAHVADDLEITITDDGVGIAPHELAKIHEPFYTTKPSGTGLGLAICRSIVGQMGGRLTIDSEPGRGTRVTVRLRAALDTHHEDHPR